MNEKAMVLVGPQRQKKKTIFRLKSQCLVLTKYRLLVNTYLLYGPEKLPGSQKVKEFPAMYAT